jgi:hypothetical protein
VFLDEATNTRSVKVENLAHISAEQPIKINLYFNNYDTSEITGSFQVSKKEKNFQHPSIVNLDQLS